MLTYKAQGLTTYLDFYYFSLKVLICIHNELFLLSIFCQLNLWISDAEPKVEGNFFLFYILYKLSWNLNCHALELSFNMLLFRKKKKKILFLPNKKKKKNTVGQRQFFPEYYRDLRVDWPLEMRLWSVCSRMDQSE